MSTIKVTNLRHESASSSNITLDSSNNAVVAGTLGCTGDLTVTSGNLVVSSGNGIDFSATGGPTNGTGSSELFDDYEEGTWTPTLGGTATYTVQTGAYTKIGRLVHASAMITVNTIGTGATKTITGLPFSIASTNNDIGVTIGYVNNAANSYVSIGSDCYLTTITIEARTAASTGFSGSSVFQSGTAVRLYIVYHTS